MHVENDGSIQNMFKQEAKFIVKLRVASSFYRKSSRLHSFVCTDAVHDMSHIASGKHHLPFYMHKLEVRRKWRTQSWTQRYSLENGFPSTRRLSISPQIYLLSPTLLHGRHHYMFQMKKLCIDAQSLTRRWFRSAKLRMGCLFPGPPRSVDSLSHICPHYICHCAILTFPVSHRQFHSRYGVSLHWQQHLKRRRKTWID